MKTEKSKQQDPKKIVEMKHLRLIQGGDNGEEKNEEDFFKQEERW